jgi:hypothetical protein
VWPVLVVVAPVDAFSGSNVKTVQAGPGQRAAQRRQQRSISPRRRRPARPAGGGSPAHGGGRGSPTPLSDVAAPAATRARTGSGQRDRRTTRATALPRHGRSVEPSEPDNSREPRRVCEPLRVPLRPRRERHGGDSFQRWLSTEPYLGYWVDVATEGRFVVSPPGSAEYDWQMVDKATGRRAMIRAGASDSAELWVLAYSEIESWSAWGAEGTEPPGSSGTVPALYSDN